MSYVKHNFVANESIITAQALNEMDDQIAANESAIGGLDGDDIAYSGSATYGSGTVGKAVKDLQSDSATNTADITELQGGIVHKANIDGSYNSMTVGNAEQLVATVGVEDKVPYNFRTSGGTADIGDREVDKIVGGTVAWNQQMTDLTTDNWGAEGGTTVTFGDGIITISSTVVNNGAYSKSYADFYPHKYFVTYECKGSAGITAAISASGVSGLGINHLISTAGAWEKESGIRSVTVTAKARMYLLARYEAYTNLQFRNVCIFDLTQMFGSTIADYIYSLETATPGAGVAWFRRLFPKPHYAYNAGKLMSVQAATHRMVGFNAYDNATGKARVVGGNVYQITGTYSALSLDGAAITPDAGGYFTPDASGEITVTGGDGTTTCIHLKWDGERDGEYQPYAEYAYPLDDSLELRGIPKLDANNALYYDGDTYESDGTVTRRYGIVDLGTLTWSDASASIPGGTAYSATCANKANGIQNGIMAKYTNGEWWSTWQDKDKVWCGNANNTSLVIKDSAYTDAATFKAAMSGVYFVYELAEPTTETADPFQSTQIVDDFGTEEYVDAGVTAATPTRDVAVPVGHETIYQANLRAKLEMSPDSPDGDGDYIVRQTNGTNEYVPLVIPAELPANPTTDGTYHLKATVSGGSVTLTWEADT